MHIRATLILAILAMLLSCAAKELIDSNRSAEPMRDDVAHSSQPVDPLVLVVGATYRLSSPSPGTPLMPRLDPIGVEELVEGLLAVRYIPAGGTITILQTAKQRHDASIYPWYFVKAESPGGFDLGTGWVNSLALLGEDLLIDSNRSAEPMRDDVNHSYRRLGRPQNVSYGLARRFSISIEIPLGRTREEVEATLRAAALDLDKRERPDAIIVFGLRPGDDHKGAYTVGRAIYAPNGKWEDAHRRAPKQFAIDIGTIYFETGTVPKAYRPGNTVALRSADGDDIGISRTAESWAEKDMIIRVPAATEAKILQRREFPITANLLLVRYQVEVRVRNRTIRGWVAKFNVEPPD